MEQLTVRNQHETGLQVSDSAIKRMGDKLAARVMAYRGNKNKMAPLVATYDDRYLSNWRDYEKDWLNMFHGMMIQSGVTEANQTHKDDWPLILDMCQKSFWGITYKEFELAFIYNLSGMHWETIGHYQEFNASYVSAVLREYRRHKGKMIKACRGELPEVEVSGEKLTVHYKTIRDDLKMYEIITYTKYMLSNGLFKDEEWRKSLEFSNWASYFKMIAERGDDGIPPSVKKRLILVANHMIDHKGILPSQGEIEYAAYAGIKNYYHILYGRLAWCYMCKNDLGPSAESLRILTILANRKFEKSVLTEKFRMFKAEQILPQTDLERGMLFRHYDSDYSYTDPNTISQNNLQDVD